MAGSRFPSSPWQSRQGGLGVTAAANSIAADTSAHTQAALSANSTTHRQDFLPLKGTDYVEFYVGNARQSAYFYRTAFGMSLVAYAGPETGQRDRSSYVL